MSMVMLNGDKGGFKIVTTKDFNTSTLILYLNTQVAGIDGNKMSITLKKLSINEN